MSITIFSKQFKFDLYCKDSGRLIVSRECYLNEIRQLMEDNGLEFVEMDKSGSDSWKMIVESDARWSLE